MEPIEGQIVTIQTAASPPVDQGSPYANGYHAGVTAATSAMRLMEGKYHLLSAKHMDEGNLKLAEIFREVSNEARITRTNAEAMLQNAN